MNNLYSMTGFAKLSQEYDFNDKKILLTVQLKSLNGRGCEILIKAPHFLMIHEITIHKLIKAHIKRGSLLCVISCEKKILSDISIPHQAIEFAFKELTDIQNKLHIVAPITFQDIFSLPDIFKDSSKDEFADQLEKPLIDLVNQTIEKLVNEFILEGDKILEALVEILNLINSDFDLIKKISKTVIDKKREQVQEKMNDFLTITNIVTYEHLGLEIFKSLEKLDIAEELQRFEAHLIRLREIFSSEENEKGKHAEFVLQELFREINTLGVKCADIKISSLVVQIKVSLEKIREQIQNIM